MRRLYSIEQFAALNPQERDGNVAIASASVGVPELAETGRIVRYVFSTPAVGRDMHTVAADAWQLQNYLRNPVFLWAHDDSLPPIGRVVSIGTKNSVLQGEVEYAERDLNPFADTIYQLVRAKYINAVSTSWQPLEWSLARDRSRPGGVDFTKVDLLEISQVPIPALPSALAEARSRGIDTGPLVEWAERLLDSGGLTIVPRGELETLRRAAKMPNPTRASKTSDWKVGVSRDLPIEDSDSWDGPAAEQSIFKWAGGDDFEPSKARKAFLVYDASNPSERGSYKLPIATVIDGELKVPKGAIRAAASRLPDTDIPKDVRADAEKALAHYKEKARIGEEGGSEEGTDKERALRLKQTRALARAPRVPLFRRGLMDVANLAWLLHQLGYAHDACAFETALEGDESKVPGMVGDALKALGEALIAMTQEEVQELLEEAEGDGDVDVGDAGGAPDPDEEDLPPEERAFVAAAPTRRARAWRRGIAIARAGKVLSTANQDRLEDAAAHHTRAVKHHKALGEHHRAVNEHLDKLRAVHKRAVSTLGELGYNHERVTRAMGEMSDTMDDLGDRHEDVGDAHRAAHRSIKAAHRNVRSVLATAVDGGDEPSTEGGTSSESSGSATASDEAEERAARERLARAHQLRTRIT